MISINPYLIFIMSILMIWVAFWALFTDIRKNLPESLRKKVVLLGWCGLFGIFGPPLITLATTQILWVAANTNIASCQFTYARWLESVPDLLWEFSVIPYEYRTEEAWYWLGRAADQGHLGAMYTIGHKVKHGLPHSIDSHFPVDPQALMDQAIKNGFVLRTDEVTYERGQYRMRYWWFR